MNNVLLLFKGIFHEFLRQLHHKQLLKIDKVRDLFRKAIFPAVFSMLIEWFYQQKIFLNDLVVEEFTVLLIKFLEK